MPYDWYLSGLFLLTVPNLIVRLFFRHQDVLLGPWIISLQLIGIFILIYSFFKTSNLALGNDYLIAWRIRLNVSSIQKITLVEKQLNRGLTVHIFQKKYKRRVKFYFPERDEHEGLAKLQEWVAHHNIPINQEL